jgi:hypothetical protein
MGPIGSKHFVAALIALIVGVVAVTVWSWQEEAPVKTDNLPDGPPHYLCGACEKEFPVADEDFAKQTPDPRIIERDGSAGYRPHCTLCGAKHTGWPMVGCPHCGKWYMPPAWMTHGAAAGTETKDVCPHCQTDRSEWYREADRKGRGKS